MKSKEPAIFLSGKPVKIIGGRFNGNIMVKRLFIGAEEMEVNKEMLKSEGGYLQIYNELKKINGKRK